MLDFYFIIFLVTGAYLMIGSLTLKTKDLLSSVIFKVIPFSLGLGCLFSAGKIAGLY